MNRTSSILILTLLFMLPVTAGAELVRWSTDDQIARGKGLFESNCASCHGMMGESTENWRETNDQGKYPPPPLNGTAHTWHHAMGVLRRTVR